MPEDPTPRGARLLGSGTARVRLLVLVVLVLALALWLAVGRHAQPVGGPVQLPWVVLLPLVAVAQAGQVHFQVRHQSHSVCLGHLPTVLGLVCSAPGGYVVARVLGGVLAMRVVRRQSGIKLALNAAAYALEAVAAVSVLHLLSAWPTPPAVYVAVVCADLCSFWVVSCAITLYEGRRDATPWLRPLTWLLPINLIATSVALLALAALWQGLGYLPLLVAVTGALLAGYRVHARLRNRHLDLGRLQDLAAALPALGTGDDPHLAEVVEQARVLLVAERAELHLADGQVVRAESPAPGAGRTAPPPPGAWRGLVLRRPTGAELRVEVPYDRGEQTAVLVVRDRLGELRGFDAEDERLLRALAALVAGGLERGADRQRLLDTARRDPLTGLWTLPEATRRAEPLLHAARTPTVLILDVMGLQDVNDSLGHDAGDALLQRVAGRLTAAVGPGAVVARLGGGEFLAVLPGGGPGAEQVARAVGGAVDVAGALLQVRVRTGSCAEGATFPALLRLAQAALAAARSGGRRAEVWSGRLEVDSSRRLRLGADLPGALERRQVVPVYQPLVRAADLQVVGAEALARWRHPELGPVGPDEFVAIAEQTGLVTDLTRVVLGEALDQVARWRGGGRDLRVSVNLSARSLLDPQLVPMVCGALAVRGLPPTALLLEVTESSLMDDLEHALQVLHALVEAGVQLALDDFGTGHSSLTHLRVLPVSEVKLDRSFLAGLGTDPSADRVVRSAVSMCHDLGKLVVAEGVEDEVALQLLHAAGADLLQGYHLGRPLPADEWGLPRQRRHDAHAVLPR